MCYRDTKGGLVMPASKAHIQATTRYEKKAYFKTLVRFKKEDEERIRKAAAGNLNGYIVKCVLDNLESALKAKEGES